MPLASDVENDLLTFIGEEILEGGLLDSPGDSLARSGVDSFGLLEIVMHLERRWNIIVPQDVYMSRKIDTVREFAELTVSQLR